MPKLHYFTSFVSDTLKAMADPAFAGLCDDQGFDGLVRVDL
jgi:hypothetical protein